MADQSHAQILLIDDDSLLLHSLITGFEMAGVGPVATVDDSRQVVKRLSASPSLVVILDLSMPYLSGLELLPKIRKQHPEIIIIILTATQELEIAVECMKLGADDYLIKPVEMMQLIGIVKEMLEARRLRSQLVHLSDQLLTGRLDREGAFADIVTCSPKMTKIFQYMESISSSTDPVLITGETGVGKELIIRALHRLSGENRPLVIENVAGLDDSIFSDTLFGHVKGAFTGAETDRQGLVSKAGNGTLVLDEIGDLSSASQIKLLRLIQERSFMPLGSDTIKEFKARILVTTHRNLNHEIAQGSFRQDLYFRLATHKVHLPPLRERREDIPLLLVHFVREAAQTLQQKIPMPPENLSDFLASYDFPGNIRELRAMVMDAASRYKRSGPLPLEPFHAAVRGRVQEGKERYDRDSCLIHAPPWRCEIPVDSSLPTLKEGLKQVEMLLVNQALKRTKGNQSHAAALLGLSPQAFNNRLRANKKKR